MAKLGLKWLRIYNWGGVNNKDASTVIDINTAQSARNHEIKRNGALEKRHKKSAYGGATTPNKESAIRGMIRGYSDESGLAKKTGGDDDYSADQLTEALIWLQTDTADDEYHLYYGSDSDGSATSLYDFADAGTANTRLRAVQWGARGVYMAIQSQGFYYWMLNKDSSCPGYIFDARLSQPSKSGASFAASADDAATAWSAANKWVSCAVTYEVGPGGAADYAGGPVGYGTWSETPGSDRMDSLEITNTAKKVKLYDWDQPAVNYRTVNVYSTDPQDSEADADAAPLYLCKTKYYDNNLSGGHIRIEWGAEFGENLDYSRPMPTTSDSGAVKTEGSSTGNYQCIEKHNDRLWVVVAGEKDKVWYSNISKPQEFGSINYFDFLDAVQCLKPYRGSLVVATEPALYALHGWSPDELGMSTEKISSKGTTSEGSVVTTHIEGREMLFRLWHKQIWAFDGTQDHWIGYPVQTTLDDMTWAQANACQAVAWRNKVMFAFPDLSKTLVYDCIRNLWYHWDDWTVGCWARWDGYADNGQLFWGEGDSGGMIYQVAESGYEMADFRYKTKAFSPEGPDTQIQCRRWRCEATRATFPLTINVDVDFGGTNYSINIPAPPATPQWGVSTSGVTWQKRGADRYEATGPFEKSIIGSYISVEPGRYDDQEKKIYGISIGYDIVGREAR